MLLFASILVVVPANTGRTQTAAHLLRGPYLQSGTPRSVVVRWRTDVAADSLVRYGSSSSTLGQTAADSAAVTEHEIRLTGLSAGTRYCYSIGSSSQTLSGGDEAHCFMTAPPLGSSAPLRIWAFGDAGFGDASQAAVRDSYYAFAGGRPTDVWLMLGDNAYDSGTDAEYQTRMFDVYRDLLKNSVLWATFGNHDARSSRSASQSGPYYDAFTFPTAGEAGGAPSGTEAYYAFDYGDVHFVCLDSEGSPRGGSDPMLAWLRADLAQNTRQWTIAFFHHPTYSKGSHDSDNPADSGGRMRDMRENAIPILEEFGVDLVLTGHSHSYERSFLLDGHYGVSTTLTDAMKIDSGDGRRWSDGAYFRPSDVSSGSHAGAVHAVSGAAGRIADGPMGHPVMVSGLEVLGSLVLDVEGSRLEGRFLDTRGAVRDGFAIEKAPLPPPRPRQHPVGDDDEPDRVNGIDGDGAYRLSWSQPPAPAQQPCGFRVEEGRLTQQRFGDDGEEPLVAGSNSKWQGEAEWTSVPHPGTATLGYWIPYRDDADAALAMRSPVPLPPDAAAVFTFSSFESIEQNFDYGLVELSADGGPYQTVASFTGEFSGTRALDLSGFAGSSVAVRFRLVSDSLISFPVQTGWFIDDVRIRTGAFAPVSTAVASATAFDVAGRGPGFWGYRVAGFFGDCGAAASIGPASRVRLIEVAGGPATADPSASFTASPNPATVGQAVLFDASTSGDNDSEGVDPAIVGYFWSFGDGATESSASRATLHAYAAPGVYRVALTVTDNEGETGTTEAFLAVVPPVRTGNRASGGGHVPTETGRAPFGFRVEAAGAGFSGKLVFHDHELPMRVQSTGVTALFVTGNRAVFQGTCTIDKISGFTYTVDVTDNGEPGSRDLFRIRLSNGYEAGGTLAGGNIQVE